MFRFPQNFVGRLTLAMASVAVAVTSILAGAAVLAPYLGLGVAEDFVFYQWLQLSRGDIVRLSVQLFLLASVVATVLVFDWRQIRRLKAPFINSLVLVASTICGLLLIEAGYRVVHGIPFLPIQNHIAVERALLRTQTANRYHPDLGWVLKPGIAIAGDNPDSTFTTGEHGIRMNAAEIRPVPTGAILAVGDSFTAGSEVGDAQTWPAQLERRLGEPVVNAGVGGWASDQIVLRAEELVPILKPHTVVVSFLAHDVLRAGFRVYGSANKPWFDLDRDGDLVRHNDPVPVFTGKPGEAGISPFGYFHVITFAMDRIGWGDWLRQGNGIVRNGNDPVAVSCKLLERLQGTLASQGAEMVFMLQYSGDERFDRTSQKVHGEKVVACARAAGIATIDTWEPLLAEFQKGFPVFQDLFVMHGEQLYGHMTEKGNALIAKLVAKTLIAK